MSYTNHLTWFFSLYKKKLILGSLPHSRRTLNVVQILHKLGLIRSFYLSLNNRITFFPKYFLGEPLLRNYTVLFKNSNSIYVLGSLRTLLLATNPSAIYLFIYRGKLCLSTFSSSDSTYALLIGCVF